MAGDLMLKVTFAGLDQLSGVLGKITGSSKNASRAVAETNKELRTQQTELRDVQRQLKASSGNVTALVDRETELERAIVRSNEQLAQRRRVMSGYAQASRISAAGSNLVGQGTHTLLMAEMAAGPLMAIAHAGAEYNSLTNRLRILGLGDGATKDLQSFAAAMDVAGSSVNENLRYLLEAQGVFRESGEHTVAEQLAGAKLMGPLLAKMHATAAGLGKELTEEDERYFLRFVEQAGGLSSPQRAAELSDGLFRALQSSGGNVQAKDYQSFLARAGIAGSHLTKQSMFADFEPMIAELHESAGVGLSTGFKMATGIKANSRAAAEFLKLGLWDRSRVTFNKLGGVKSTNGNPLIAPAADALTHSPVDFYRQFILPAYAKAGIRTSEQRAFENAKIFGGTGGNLFNLIDKQLPTILKSRMAFQKTQGLETAYTGTKDSFFGQQGKLTAAWKNFMIAAGTKGGIMDGLVGGMKAATSALKTFTALGNSHPKAFAWLGKALAHLLMIRVGLAVVRIAVGGALGPIATLWKYWANVREVGFVVKFVTRFGSAIRLAGGLFARLGPLALRSFGMVRMAAMFLARGVVQAGAMMLANPMVLAIVAIGAALGVLAYLAYKHWDKVKAAFASALNYLRGLWGNFTAIGGHLLDGLLGGITSKLAALKAGIVGIGDKIVSWFKGRLGIHSPSRVFAGLGGHLATGLAMGIDRGAQHPIRRTRQLAGQLAAAMAMGAATPALAVPIAGSGRHAASGAAAVHHHQHNYTITVQGNDNPEAQARRIWAEIKKLQAREIRGSFKDTH